MTAVIRGIWQFPRYLLSTRSASQFTLIWARHCLPKCDWRVQLAGLEVASSVAASWAERSYHSRCRGADVGIGAAAAVSHSEMGAAEGTARASASLH
jgi:hypothetical protein